VKTELAAAADPEASPKNTSEPGAPRARTGKRQSSPTASSGTAVRFFLSKLENNGTPVLDREFPNEAEAILESLKTGKTYFVISEWRGSADVSKKMPLIRKDLVRSKKQTPD
jgi:hypothetical protein